MVDADTQLVVWIPGRLTNPLNGPHRHWSVQARERKGWRERTFLHCTDVMMRERWHIPPRTPKLITLRVSTWNTFDEDGLAAALKPVIDGLRDAGIVHDDSPRACHAIIRRQQINRRRRGVEVVVEVAAGVAGVAEEIVEDDALPMRLTVRPLDTATVVYRPWWRRA